MHLSVAVSKINKWAVRQGGDTMEMVERPHGGLSLILADGQSSGRGAKTTSIWVVRKVLTELAEGVRDGAAARAANDVLHALRGGKVSATLVIVSVDLHSRSIVLTRCGNSAIYVRGPGEALRCLEGESPPLGFYRHARPLVDEFPLAEGLMVCAFTDGVLHAGSRTGRRFDIPATIDSLWAAEPQAQTLADGLLAQVVAADDGRPVDDTSIVVLHVQPGEAVGPRRLQVEMPLTVV